VTAPATTPPPASIGNAYTKALLDARSTGYALGAEGIARLRAMFGRAIQDLTRELALAGDDQVTVRRALALRAQIEATLALIERRIAEITRETAQATAEAVVAIHRDVNLDLARQHRPDLVGRLADSFDVVNVRAAATFAARGQVAATFRTLARRNVQEAAPALDLLLGSSIARGVSSGRLTKDVAALLAGGKPDLKTYGLDPSDVSGLRTLFSDARRIAVTETNNALREGNRMGLLASPIVKAVKWQTSGRHDAIAGLAPDECDDLAEGNDPEDLAELGPLPPGYYSPKRFPLAPHPYCACVQGGPTIFYRPSEWGKILGRKPPEPTLTDFEVLVARALALLDEGKDRRIVFRAMRAEFPGETAERIGQAITEAEIRANREGFVIVNADGFLEDSGGATTGGNYKSRTAATTVLNRYRARWDRGDKGGIFSDPHGWRVVRASLAKARPSPGDDKTDDQLVAALKTYVLEERPTFGLASANKITLLASRELQVDRVRLFPLLDRARRELAVEDHDEILARAVQLLKAPGGGKPRVEILVEEFGILQEDASRILAEADALPKEKTFEEWVEAAIEILRGNGFKPGATAIALVGQGATAEVAAQATEEAMNRLANVDDDEVVDRAKTLLRGGVTIEEVPFRLQSQYKIGTARAYALTQRALAELGSAVDYAAIETEARRIASRGFGPDDFDRIVDQLMNAFLGADRTRVEEIVRRVLTQENTVDYFEVRQWVEGVVASNPTIDRFTLFSRTMAQYPAADRSQVDDIVADVLAKAAGTLDPALRAELEAQVERELRAGSSATVIITLLNQDPRLDTVDRSVIERLVLAVQSAVASRISDADVEILARALLAQGKSGSEVENDLVRSVLAGDSARARRIVAPLLAARQAAEAARQAKTLGGGRQEAEVAREKLRAVAAEADAEIAALAAEKAALLDEISKLDAALAAERDRLRREMPLVSLADRLAAENSTEVGRLAEELSGRLLAVEDRAREARALRYERAIQAVEVPKHSAGTFNVRSRLPKIREKWQRGIDVLRRIVPKEVLDGFETDLKLKPGRAHYSTGDGAFMDKFDPFTTVVHELGHAIEYYRPEILRQSQAWRDGRTVGEGLQRLSKIYPRHGYGASEVTRPDKFFHAYIGKDYGTRASEVLSMGLEEMARDPIGFAEKDPDMFDFIFAVLRSAMDKNPAKRGKIA
jgi:hypothetical protein